MTWFQGQEARWLFWALLQFPNDLRCYWIAAANMTTPRVWCWIRPFLPQKLQKQKLLWRRPFWRCWWCELVYSGHFFGGSLVKTHHLEDLKKLFKPQMCWLKRSLFATGVESMEKIARFFQAGPATGATAESSEWWKIPKPSEDGRMGVAEVADPCWLFWGLGARIPWSYLFYDRQEDEQFFCHCSC